MDRPPQRRRNSYELSRDLTPHLVPVAGCNPLGRDTRKHTPQQVHKLAASLERFGFVLPILINADGRVIGGWGLVLAARRLGLSKVPAVSLTDLSDAELRLLRLALNRITDDAAWDREALALEFSDILDLAPQIELELSGFEMGEIDMILGEPGDADDAADQIPELDPALPSVTQQGDLWQLGRHRLLCADATKPESFDRLMSGELAQMCFTDPPYNVPIDGHVSGLGKVKHAEFAMASGEMTEEEFTAFLETVFNCMAEWSHDGAIHFVCMDWRHLFELLAVGRSVFKELKNLCVWTKMNGGMGSLYRSQHELVVVFKKGSAPHINNVELGRHGRHRTNVWTYPGMNSFGAKRDESLSLHPTVKPVALVEDAILDCSKRGGVILDAFVGSGTTLIAAERAGRRAFGLELESRYVDVALRRFRNFTGVEPLHVESGLTLKEIEDKTET